MAAPALLLRQEGLRRAICVGHRACARLCASDGRDASRGRRSWRGRAPASAEAKAALDRLADRLARLLAAIVNVARSRHLRASAAGFRICRSSSRSIGRRVPAATRSRATPISPSRAPTHGEKSGVRGAARAVELISRRLRPRSPEPARNACSAPRRCRAA